MATLLFNNIENDTKIINQVYNEDFFKSFFIKYKDQFIEQNLLDFPMSEKYNYRPDIVSYKIYGEEFYYPLLLQINNIGSIAQFTVNYLGNNIKYLDPDILTTLIQKI